MSNSTPKRKRLTLKQREKADTLLATAAELQWKFWNAVTDLERLVRADIDSTQDLDGMTLEEVLEGADLW